MSNLFWDSLREEHVPRVNIFLSRGGKGSSVKNFQEAAMRRQIKDINDNVSFVGAARDAEYIVIPDDANLLADKKTHARTKMLGQFLTMLKKTNILQTPTQKESKPKKTSGSKVMRQKQTPLSEITSAWQSILDATKSSHKEKSSDKSSQKDKSSHKSSQKDNLLHKDKSSYKSSQKDKSSHKSSHKDVSALSQEPTPSIPVSQGEKPVLTFLNFAPSTTTVKVEKEVPAPQRKIQPVAPPPETLPVGIINMVAPKRKVQPSPLENTSAANILAPQRSITPIMMPNIIENQPRVAPNAAKLQKPKPGKATFPCVGLTKDIMDKFKNEERVTFDDIKPRVKAMFDGFNDQLITKIAWYIEDKLQPEYLAEEGEPEQDPLFVEKKKGTQDAEDLIDEFYNATMDEFKKIENPTDEEYEAMLDDLESSITKMMRKFSYEPSQKYLENLAAELWTFRDGYSSADVAQGIRNLVDEWKDAYFEENFQNKYQKLTLTDSQQKLYEKLFFKIEETDAETMQLLLKELSKIIQSARKHHGDDVLKFKDKYAGKDLRAAMRTKYPKVEKDKLFADFAKFWESSGFPPLKK